MTPGTVYLVGAGPGDPGLLTVRATELIARADVILHDRLIPAQALAGARPDAELVYVGKQGGGPQMPQEEINRLLLEHAQAGRDVVRLKGGDPFVFGRGGEEALVCLEAGVPFEVVPGVTAGVAAPAYAGIPVTHRELASGVAFVTGPREPRQAGDRAGLAGAGRVPRHARLLHGRARAPAHRRAADRRRAAGRRAGRGGRARHAARPAHAAGDARRRRGTRRGGGDPRPGDHARRAGRRAARAARLAGAPPAPWPHGRRHARPAAGERARRPAARARRRRRSRRPRSAREPLDAALPDLAAFDLVCVTSPNGAHALFARLDAAGLDARALAGRTVAAIGPGTARALAEHGIRADVVPSRAVAEGLVDALEGRDVRRALVVRGREGRDVLPDALRERGAEVELLLLYETVAEPLDPDTARAAAAADYVTFTSASTVRFFLAAAGSLDGPRIASIGPATSAALREAGHEPDVEADPHTPDGLVAALLADAATLK